ncbi:MAG: MFS transporter [Oscillospiraceae bacterium]|nr:MFS transporter [Oscillospiraceae bacterium]
MAIKREKNPNTLWTKDFTIITLGSVVSMFGNAMSGFAMSLMVLDYTQSALYFAIYVAIFTLPQIVMPIFSGAILDRFSRKKTIYTLDFISAGLYALVAVLLSQGIFNFALFAVYVFILGSINSIYMVAFESFYPLLITEGNYSKAYSISSLLETLSAVMVPVSTYFYNLVGIAPLLGANAVCFFIAAVMETRIGAEEKYIEKRQLEDDSPPSGMRLLRDIKEGFKYLLAEKGLLAVAVYFTFSSLASGASSVITLPFFKGSFNNGEYIYMLVWGMALVGRAVGGAAHYRIKLPVKAKFAIALTVYIVTSLLEGFYLYTTVPLMMIMCFITGLGGVTSYTIRISSTQSYVPDEKKGRFNGAFNMLNTTGAFAGELLAGAMTTVIPVRGVLTCFMVVNAVAAVAIIGGSRKSVAAIYNRDQ